MYKIHYAVKLGKFKLVNGDPRGAEKVFIVSIVVALDEIISSYVVRDT